MPGPLRKTILGIVAASATPDSWETMRLAARGETSALLRTQLHAMLLEHTELDRELDALRRSNIIRMFKLATGERMYSRDAASTGYSVIGCIQHGLYAPQRNETALPHTNLPFLGARARFTF